MTGKTEERLNALNREIADLELQRNSHVSVIEILTERKLDTASAKAMLCKIDEQIAALRIRTATFAGDRRHV